MTELYNCFLEKRYPEEWDVDWKENTHYSLGLFLVLYLGNGFNLADAAHLTYNDHYFQSGKKSFHLYRLSLIRLQHRLLKGPWYSREFMVMLWLLLTGGSASLWKTRTSRNMSVVLSRVWAGKSSRAVLGADTPLPRTLPMPEFLITIYPRVWVTL